MNHKIIAAACLLLPLAAAGATRNYETTAFEAISTSAGVDVEVSLGTTRSVVAETRAGDFDDLRVAVEGNTLVIDRPRGRWFFFRRPNFTVRVVTPVLRSITASSGADVEARGASEGDFAVSASSGSDVQVTGLRGGSVKAHASSGSDLELAGTCSSLAIEVSSGSDLDASALRCETVVVQASSGSDVSVSASRSVTGSMSSGSDLEIAGAPANVQVDKSSGADVTVRR